MCKWGYLNLPMLFEGQLDEGVLAVLVGTWLLVGRRWVQMDNYFCTTATTMQQWNGWWWKQFTTLKLLLLLNVDVHSWLWKCCFAKTILTQAPTTNFSEAFNCKGLESSSHIQQPVITWPKLPTKFTSSHLSHLHDKANKLHPLFMDAEEDNEMQLQAPEKASKWTLI